MSIQADEPGTAERHPAAMISRPGCRDSAVYVCIGCGADVCPDCTPSPREADGICGDCYYAAETDESGTFTRAYEAVTGRRFVPRNLDFAGWTREAVGDTEGEDRAAVARGDYSSESERRRASDDHENQAERAAAIARNEEL